MSFIEQAYLEIKTIDPSITATEFSTKWLNKCSSYYRSYKTRNRDMTLHALMCFLMNLSKKADALRMNNNNALLQQRADQYQALRELVSEQVTLRISTRWTQSPVDIFWDWLYFLFMKTSVHGFEKKLRREQRHEQWLRKNLKSSNQHWECRKKILKLHTKTRVDLKK